ncbi:MAG TPA: heme-binding protein, partial [Thermoanaerobaculia bacterium]|nr:heme-binding protein [Thermoanaerobaculia bacterium]
MLLLTLAAEARVRAVRPRTIAEDPACALTPATQITCSDGGTARLSLSAAEVETIIRAAARALNDNTLTIAVVDRAGRPLAVFRKSGADPANDDRAVGIARTAAFFSHNQAPLSSRTVRFISGIHFPPGITNTPSAALYGIENTNRGCDFNVSFNAGKCIPRARRLGGATCQPGDTSGCGTGIVTEAGAVPLYRVEANRGNVSNPQLLGAIGVAGVSDAQRAEFAAATGGFGSIGTGIVPVPFFPIPHPGNVFIDG